METLNFEKYCVLGLSPMDDVTDSPFPAAYLQHAVGHHRLGHLLFRRLPADAGLLPFLLRFWEPFQRFHHAKRVDQQLLAVDCGRGVQHACFTNSPQPLYPLCEVATRHRNHSVHGPHRSLIGHSAAQRGPVGGRDQQSFYLHEILR